MTTGLVIGKFYPPHNGHHYIIEEALKRCDRLFVLVWWSEVESIPGFKRAEILAEVHPRAIVYDQKCEIKPDYESDDVWSEHMELLKQKFPSFAMGPHSHSLKDYKFDYVFTSEDYGDELARRVGASHVAIDPKRLNVPISGTAIRKDPAANWQHLAEPTRALLTKRFVVTGAESTGTTTLTRALAQHYNTVWVPEYGRFYTEGSGLLNHEWTTDEFVHIVEGQHLAEDFLARKAGPVMFCDTDALSTAVWHERYVWEPSPEVIALIRDYEHYFVTDWNEVKLEDDGLRDGNDGIRAWMQERLIQTIDEHKDKFGYEKHVLLGGPRMRIAAATEVVDACLKSGWNLADPL